MLEKVKEKKRNEFEYHYFRGSRGYRISDDLLCCLMDNKAREKEQSVMFGSDSRCCNKRLEQE